MFGNVKRNTAVVDEITVDTKLPPSRAFFVCVGITQLSVATRVIVVFFPGV